MVIFELPSEPRRGATLALALGSCRITVPIRMFAPRAELKVRAAGMQATHSSAEALQALAFAAGDVRIAESLRPYVFGADTTPRPDNFGRCLQEGVDSFLLEISDDRQFIHGDCQLQLNFVASHLVRPHGSALLEWFRTLGGGRAIDAGCIRSTLEKLAEAGRPADEMMVDLLSNIRLVVQTETEIAAQLRSMMTRWGGRWTLVGVSAIPGEAGAAMRRRRLLNEKLARVARQCGAAFYDPSELIATYGRTRVLDGGGVNIHEYAREFRPIVSETLLNLARGEPRGDGAASPRHVEKRRVAFAARSRLADRVNAELLALHGQRLVELGVDESGLGAHYQALAEHRTLVGEREKGVLELLWTYLPAYDAYAVMRAGLGEMALLLAASGRRTIAFEPYERRRAAIEAGRTRLEAVGLLRPNDLTIVAGLTPDEPFEGAVLGVGLDVAQVHTEEDAEPHYRSLAKFDALLIDLHAFLRLRASPEDEEAAVRRIHASGFVKRRDYADEVLSWFRRDA